MFCTRSQAPQQATGHASLAERRQPQQSPAHLIRRQSSRGPTSRRTLEVVEELRRGGVDLVTVADGFDLNGPAAEIILAVMAWAAKMERLALNERIAAARARLEAEGRPWGRPPRLDPKTRAAIAERAAAGASIREIAQAVRVPRSTVARAVALSRNPPPGKGTGSAAGAA